VTVGGRYKAIGKDWANGDGRFSFACWRLALLITLVPLLFLTLASFMARFGYFNVAKPWTSVHWAASLQIPCFSNP